VEEADIQIHTFGIKQIFIAQVYLSLKRYDEALEEIEKGIKHTPTIVELYVTKVQILSKSGRESEALETAKILSQLDPADRNSNNIYVRQLFRNGYAKEAKDVAEPFSIDQKKKPRLYKTEFNKIHFRAARCSLRGGDVENALHFYQDVVSHFDEYKNGMISYFSWGVRRLQSILDMIEWEATLVNHKQNGKAYANVARIFIQRGQLKELRPESLRFSSKNQESCAYACINFALLKEPILALKPFLKLQGSWRYAAMPAMKIAAEAANSLQGVAKDVFFELYKPTEEAPTSVDDLLANARGLIYVKKFEEAKASLLKAAESVDEYKTAVDIFLAAKIEMQDEKLAKELEAKIHEKHPLYEIEFKNGYSPDAPHEHSVKREK
jgi:tetratricopeptide (TPR) repeat protein